MPPPSSLIADFAGLQAAFAASHAASRLDMAPSLALRRQRLDALEALLRDNVNALCAAVSADFGHRSSHETQLLEVFPSLEGIRHTRRHLGTWIKPQRRSVSLWFQPARAELRPQALLHRHHLALELSDLSCHRAIDRGARRRQPGIGENVRIYAVDRSIVRRTGLALFPG